MSKNFFLAVVILSLLGLPGLGVAQGGPMMGKANSGTEQVTAEKLAKSEKEYKAAKAAYAKNTKDAKLKKKYVDSTVTFGMANMYAIPLPPNKKYRYALQYFREALKVDPKNKLAKENLDLIVSIYKSMGKEVPKS